MDTFELRGVVVRYIQSPSLAVSTSGSANTAPATIGNKTHTLRQRYRFLIYSHSLCRHSLKRTKKWSVRYPRLSESVRLAARPSQSKISMRLKSIGLLRFNYLKISRKNCDDGFTTLDCVSANGTDRAHWRLTLWASTAFEHT